MHAPPIGDAGHYFAAVGARPSERVEQRPCVNRSGTNTKGFTAESSRVINHRGLGQLSVKWERTGSGP